MKLTSISPILNVSDVPASLAWFERLAWTRSFTWNSAGMIAEAGDRNEAGPAEFAGVCSGDCTILLCHNGQGSRGGPRPVHPGDDQTGGVWMSWWLPSPADVDIAHSLAVREGITVGWPPTDEPWGVRECHLIHPDGHTFRVSAALPESESAEDQESP